MGNIVDFNEAKAASDKKKKIQDKQKRTNDKLVGRMKNTNNHRHINAKYYYLGLFLISAIFVIIKNIQP